MCGASPVPHSFLYMQCTAVKTPAPVPRPPPIPRECALTAACQLEVLLPKQPALCPCASLSHLQTHLPSFTGCFYAGLNTTGVSLPGDSTFAAPGNVTLACARGFSGSGIQAGCSHDGAWTVYATSCTAGEAC